MWMLTKLFMTNCYKRGGDFRRLLLGAGSLLMFFCGVGCTEVDDRLGETLLPGGQRMKVEVREFTDEVQTYLFRTDSIPSSRLGHAYLGRMVDPEGVFGAQTNSALLQFLPVTLPYGEDVEGFGFEPIVDSLNITFAIDDIRGDSLLVQSFEVYDISTTKDKLTRDSLYRANFPIEEYRGEKLFDFTHSGRRSVQARLFPTAAGRQFIDRLVNIDWETYKSDTLFLEEFRGIYIAPAAGSPRAGSVWAASLASSGLTLHLRNHDSLDVTAIYDTLAVPFLFTDQDETDARTGAVTEWNSVSIAMSEFDYSEHTLGELEVVTNGFTDTLPTSPTQPTVYVQTMGGVGTYLRFSDEFVRELQALKEGDDHDIMINQAMMRLYIEGGESVPRSTLDAAVTRLGSYRDITRVTPISDYQYSLEAMQNAQNASTGGGEYKLPYDGYFYRGTARYQLVITSYIQQLIDGKVPPVMQLGPDVAGRFGFGNSTLNGTGSEMPITVRITYTIIDR